MQYVTFVDTYLQDIRKYSLFMAAFLTKDLAK